jgi:predicted metalloprotease with PDZ domain
MLQVEVELHGVARTSVEVCLPSWRPGRYELGNFAKNMSRLVVSDAEGEERHCRKLEKDRWEADATGTDTLRFTYTYYAADLNAGSTYLDEHTLYVNPVNCLIYFPGRMEEECTVELVIPSTFTIACALPEEGRTLKAAGYHELADSPFIAGSRITHHGFTVNGYRIHLWLNGEHNLDLVRMEKDFSAFIGAQIQAYGSLPVPEFHFLVHVKPHADYHGVEHLTSTVLAIGPSHALMGSYYSELLGLSSHEFYHIWNIKSIRPLEMHPYDYSRENYSELGFVAEGVTTYMGDLFLLRGGVFNLDDYLLELNKLLIRHFDNYGRLNYSVAESSFDTWLDGYGAGVPWRKVSIYTEGALLAFITDVMVMESTENRYRLDHVMRRLYEDFALKGLGYTEDDYRSAIEDITDRDMELFFRDFVHGTPEMLPALQRACSYLGLKIERQENGRLVESRFGIKTAVTPEGEEIRYFAPGSPADKCGLMPADRLVALNDFVLNRDVDAWLSQTGCSEVKLTVQRQNRLVHVLLRADDTRYFPVYRVVADASATAEHVQNRMLWGGMS